MKTQNIGIVTFSISKSGVIPLSNFVDIFSTISTNLYLISVNEGYTYFKSDSRVNSYGIFHERGSSKLTRIINYIHSQFKISLILIKLYKKTDIFVFTIGGDCLLLPMITAKLLGKKVVLAFSGSSVKTLRSANDKSFKMLSLVSMFTIPLSNNIILYSPNNIQEFGLEKYKSKIDIASKHFLDFDKFKLKKSYVRRENLIGYIGRFSEEKGILNFVKAIPLVLNNYNVTFLLIGDGQLRKDIEDYVSLHKLEGNVRITGWINHDNLPDYLNELKLLVLPSYTEGLPNVMLEAMACGTPVLATPVGSIPDIILSGQNGFIMTDNSPECIAKNVAMILGRSDMEKISDNSSILVRSHFNFDSAVRKYSNIMKKL